MQGLLVFDACELIVCYLGAMGDAMRLGLTCREWHHHVRHSRVWRQRLERRAPHSTAVLDADEAGRRERDDYAFGIAWQTHLAASRRNAFGRATNYVTAEANSVAAPTFMARVGGWLKRQYDSNFDEIRMMVFGLPRAGKASFALHWGENRAPIGLAHEKIEYQRFRVRVWSVGFAFAKVRPLWRHFAEGTRCVIFVVDSADRETMSDSAEESGNLLTDPDLAGAALCVMANKQDLPDAMPPDEVAHQLGLPAVPSPNPRRWCAQGCCATSGEGVQLALNWIAAAVTNRAST